jgi:hypothetical protein
MRCQIKHIVYFTEKNNDLLYKVFTNMDEIEVSPNFFSSRMFTNSLFTDLTDKVSENNPVLVIVVLLILILYYMVFSSISNIEQNNSTNNITGSGIGFIEISLWSVFIFLLVINGLQFFFSIDVKTVVRNMLSTEPEIEVTVESPQLETNDTNILNTKEVFHIPGNKYTYKEAKALCKAYNSDLASYDQIQNSYKAGGEWCSYGWSKDQLALYPTQKHTYEKLKTIKGHEHDCGRPGINGGFIKNENVRFGVNCFGYKPKITKLESEHMAYTDVYPKSTEDLKKDQQIEEYKKKIPNIMLSPFNKTKWSRI